MRFLDEFRGELIRTSDAIRLKCLDCCGNQKSEVNLCPAIECPLWQYRIGKCTPMDPEQRRKVAEHYEKASKTGSKHKTTAED